MKFFCHKSNFLGLSNRHHVWYVAVSELRNSSEMQGAEHYSRAQLELPPTHREQWKDLE